MTIEFTAHNIRLDDGTLTKPDVGHTMEAYPWFVSAKRILDSVFPGDKRHLRLADLGCLEGGYAVEFGRMGFQVLGIEVREENIAVCDYVKSKTNLPNLEFVKDNAWNIVNYGMFDVVFCCGLLYHLDKPKEFLNTISTITKRLLFLQTHFSINNFYTRLPAKIRNVLVKVVKGQADIHSQSRITYNEGLPGRWYTEFVDENAFSKRGQSKWASWDNRRSFWIQREYLLQAIQDVGFDLVMEQFDNLGPNMAESMLRGTYRTNCRGTFIGIKTQNSSKDH